MSAGTTPRPCRSRLRLRAFARASALLLALGSAPVCADWQFVDVSATARAQVQHGLLFGFSGEPDMMAGGAAAADLDGDGDPDLIVVTGDLGAPRILRNRGNGVFDDVTAGSGLIAEGIFNGVVAADVDGDGRLDLLFGGLGGQPPRLFRNLGDLRFAALDSGLAISNDTWSAALADFDGDEVLDLALGRWARGEGRGGHLWRGLGQGRFANADARLGIAGDLAALAYTFTPNFGDLDGDGAPDLVWAADFGTSRVLLNRAGHFVDATTPAVDDENGMGSALADYDGDGDLDWFVSSIWDPDGVAFGNWGVSGNRLYRNLGDGRFEDVSAAAGVRQGWWGWASCFADFDLDGVLDLAHVNGMSAAQAPEFHADPSRLFMGDGSGGFVEQSQQRGLLDTGQGRALVCFDVDGDGDIDLFIQNNSGMSRLLRNEATHSRGWLGVALRNRAPNTFAVGARIELRAGGRSQMREIQAGSNYLASNPPEAHFGLGAATRIDALQVRWPDGEIERFAVPVFNRRIELVRGTGLGGAPAPPRSVPGPALPWLAIAALLMLLSARSLLLRSTT